MPSRPVPVPLLLILSGMLLLSTAVAGKAYRWVDENGLTHYTQTPPPDKPATAIEPPPPPVVGGQKAWDQLDRQWQENETRKETVQKQQLQESEEAKLQAAREANCNAARNNLENLQGPPRRLVRSSDGEYRRMDPAERQQQIEKAEQMIEENCD